MTERNEFKNFLESREEAPASVSRAVLSRAHRELHPPFFQVFGKLAVLHGVVGFLVVLVCPQLGVSPWGGGHGLLHVFMAFGPLGCAALCGAIFLGTSLGLASFLLRPEEIREARRFRFAHVSSLAALSLAALILGGASETETIYLVWLMGAVVGGLLATSGGWRLRQLSS